MKRIKKPDGERSAPQRGTQPVRSGAGQPAPMLVTIEKPIYGGAFLARAEGKAIFTPLTLPGEQARVCIVDDRRGYAFAEAEEIVSAAPERTTPPCPHFGPCGGCHYQHAGYEAQIAFKEDILRETLERAGVSPPKEITVLAGEPWKYRNRIRLAFDAAGNPGYRGRRSHDIVPIRECPIAAPVLVDAALAAAELFRHSSFAGRPAEMSLFCDARESALLFNAKVANPSKALVEDFSGELGGEVPALRGVEFSTEGLPGRQSHASARWGASSLVYRVANFDYRVDFGAFFQVNRWLVDEFVESVAAGHRGNVAWDLYAGVGLFSRRLSTNFDRVIAVESASAAMPALEANLAGTSATAHRGTTIEFLHRGRTAARPDLIVVDPPRAGLGAEVTTRLAEIAAPALVYVSCDPATLARDLRPLLSAGYTIEDLSLADLFPQTFHIETVVQLRRA
jgi:23S rRNA (uracil1939-C5)-methyltransferase